MIYIDIEDGSGWLL